MSMRADVVFLNGLVLEGIIACKLFTSRPVAVKVVGDLIWERARHHGYNVGLEAFQKRRQPLRWELLKKLQAWYVRKADRVIVPSQFLASIVAGWGVAPERVTVVYNSVENEPGKTASGRHPDFDIVTVARLVPWKGIAELIDLANENGWSLRVVGDGPLRSALEKRATRPGMHASVSFSGQVPRERMRDELRRGRVFVLNSSYEGLPHVVIEAMAAGVPVVATAVGGTPETIRDGIDGYQVAPGDLAVLSDRIRELLADSDLQQSMGQAGTCRVAERFSFSSMVRDTERVLREVCGLTQGLDGDKRVPSAGVRHG
jgi:glycosyltransferase involved in cell wall biosynthesis